MDIYAQAISHFQTVVAAGEWNLPRAQMEAAAANSPPEWRLPLLACEAVGGTAEQAIPAVTAIGCLQLAIIQIDDMLDSDRRGLYHRLGLPATANLAQALQAAGLLSIVHCAAPETTRLATAHHLSQMMLDTACGQHMDVQNPADAEAYWRLVRQKSAPFFAGALQVGALLGGVTTATAEQIMKFGLVYGEAVQIHDDLQDVMERPANPDWLQGRSPLPILFAQTVDHPLRERFQEIRPGVSDPDLLAEAQTILIRCGAVSYCVHQICQRHERMQQQLAELTLVRPEKLEKLVSDVIRPVSNLLTAMGNTNQPPSRE